MYETAVGIGTELISTYGLAILLIVFALEGALVGKLIPTRALFIAAVLALGSDGVGLASVFLVAVLGATIGQVVLFTLVRQTSLATGELPGESERIGESRIQGWLERWGTPAIAVSNVLPVVRGTLTVPAAMTDDSALRFSSAAFAGTTVYVGGLTVLALGLDVLLGVV